MSHPALSATYAAADVIASHSVEDIARSVGISPGVGADVNSHSTRRPGRSATTARSLEQRYRRHWYTSPSGA